jgi:drug/metabolite transporter (DMT)-like permease
VLALVSATAFSTLGLFAKLIYAEGWSVPEALAWRFAMASLLLWALVILGRRPLPKPVAPVLLLGLLGFVPQAGLYFVTVRMLDPGITSLLLYLYPAFVVLFGFLFLGRKPGTARILALALSLIGCGLTFWKRGDYPLAGLLLGVVVGLAYGAYLLAGERILAGTDPLSATAVLMGVAALSYGGLALAGDALSGRAFPFPSSLAAILGVAGVSLIATVLAITTLFAAMGRLGAADTSLVSTLEPVLTIGLSALFLGERITATRAAGGALILGAVLLIRFAAEAEALLGRLSPRAAGRRRER